MTATFSDLLVGLSADTERAATAVATRYVSQEITLTEAATALELVVRTGNTRGSTLGAAACREVLATLGEYTLAVAAPAALAHADDIVRIGKAVTTVLAGRETAVSAAARLARSEAVEAAQTAFGSVLGQSKKVRGWKRGMESDPCELCSWWSRDGRVWPKDYTLQRHKGCTCRQVPVTITQATMTAPGERAWRASDQRREAQHKENR